MASIDELLNGAEVAIKDFFDSKFDLQFTDTKYVPSYEDGDLTFERGLVKKGKEIETCVLFIDIRNSVKLNKSHRNDTMAKLYAAFVKVAIYAAYHHNGAVRNIIGDRVMIVFQQDECFTNAVHCALSLNHMCNQLLNRYFKFSDFKCGIGIDHGRMRVIKAGTRKRGAENSYTKNLIWVGDPANIASRLTDMANKEHVNKEMLCTVEERKINPLLASVLSANKIPTSTESHINVRNLDAELFAKYLVIGSNGELSLKNDIPFALLHKSFSSKLLKAEYRETNVKVPPILMTEKVYNTFKLLNPQHNSLVNKWWHKQDLKIKDYSGLVIGGDVFWKTKKI